MDTRKLKDKIFAITVIALSIVAIAPVFHIIAYVSYKGLPIIMESGLEFFTSTPNAVTDPKPGGIAQAIIGTLYLTVTATIIAVPIATLAAIFSSEFPRSKLTHVVRAASRSLLEVATIIVGMLVFALLVLPTGRFTAMAGSVALAIVMIPYVYTYVELAMLSVPQTYVDAAYSLGMSRVLVIYHKLRIMRRGVARGIMIGVSKAMGETAPLLFTAFGARNILFGGPFEPIDALPLMIFQFIMTGHHNWIKLAWGGAFVLLISYLALFIITRVMVKEVRY